MRCRQRKCASGSTPRGPRAQPQASARRRRRSSRTGEQPARGARAAPVARGQLPRAQRRRELLRGVDRAVAPGRTRRSTRG
eukprot:314742-Prymnesium_polylepis.1